MPAGISEMKTDLEKANAVFSYIQKTFTWNKDRGIYPENGIRKMLESKVGNAAEINRFSGHDAA